jgi:PAS domain S-box-containing protein
MAENKKSLTVKPGARFPALYFSAALAASAASLFLMFSNSRGIYEATGELHDRHYRLLNAAGSLIMLDSRLSMAASLAASTGEPLYEREYERLAPELDASIKKLSRFTGAAEGSPRMAEINKTNLQLIDLERRALRLSRAGKKREASAQLAGREYQEYKKTYARAISELLKEFEAALLVEGAASRRGIIKSSVAAAACVFASLLFWVLAALSARRWFRVRGSTEALVAEKEAEYRHFFDTVQEVFYRADWKGVLTNITPSITKYSGYKPEELVGKPVSDLYQNPEDRKLLIKELILKGIVEDYEVKLKTKDRGILDVLVNARLLKGFAGLPAGLEGSLRDITARKAAEDKLRRMNRLYGILRRLNGVILRAHSPQSLYEDLCRAAVEEGGIKFAWVGMPGPGGSIVPAASCGEGEDYLRELQVSIYASLPEGRGPSGAAAREGKIFVNSDTENNPAMVPWREAALKRGFRSSATFPIGGGGVVNFYASETGFFVEEEKVLLSSLGGDIAYAVNSINERLAGAIPGPGQAGAQPPPGKN